MFEERKTHTQNMTPRGRNPNFLQVFFFKKARKTSTMALFLFGQLTQT